MNAYNPSIIVSGDRHGTFYAVVDGAKVITTTREIKIALDEAGRDAHIRDTSGGEWEMQGGILVLKGSKFPDGFIERVAT